MNTKTTQTLKIQIQKPLPIRSDIKWNESHVATKKPLWVRCDMNLAHPLHCFSSVQFSHFIVSQQTVNINNIKNRKSGCLKCGALNIIQNTTEVFLHTDAQMLRYSALKSDLCAQTVTDHRFKAVACILRVTERHSCYTLFSCALKWTATWSVSLFVPFSAHSPETPRQRCIYTYNEVKPHDYTQVVSICVVTHDSRCKGSTKGIFDYLKHTLYLFVFFLNWIFYLLNVSCCFCFLFLVGFYPTLLDVPFPLLFLWLVSTTCPLSKLQELRNCGQNNRGISPGSNNLPHTKAFQNHDSKDAVS